MKGLLLALLCMAMVAGCGLSRSLTASTASSSDSPASPSSSPGRPPAHCQERGSGLFALPDPRCTPGAMNSAVTPATIHSTICHSGWTSTVRPPVSVTDPEKLIVAKAYGVRDPHETELDHLIPLELGGAPNSYKNFWDEPNYPNVSPNTFDHNPKDKLEFKMKKLVCSGRLPLADAQREIATNWVAAYQRYEGRTQ